MSEQEEIELWEDDSVTLMESEIEEGSELAEAVNRRAPRETPSKSVPPHGPRAYKRPRPRSPIPRPAAVPEDEVLFDDARDFHSLPTVKIELAKPDSLEVRPARARLHYAFIAAVLLMLLGGAIAAHYWLEARSELERREEIIRERLKAR